MLRNAQVIAINILSMVKLKEQKRTSAKDCTGPCGYAIYITTLMYSEMSQVQTHLKKGKSHLRMSKDPT